MPRNATRPSALAALHRVLDGLRAKQTPPPCDGDERFTAESPAEREQVLEACRPCPIRAACFTAGRNQKWGIWGGIDRSTDTTGRTNRARGNTTTRRTKNT